MEGIAILYQAKLPPVKDGVQKPMKPGGYSDSGADMAFALKKNGLHVVTPTDQPREDNDLDWVFPDTPQGIRQALGKGAKIFWLNTVLYKGHAIENFFNEKIELVGQLPAQVEIYDDKWVTNKLLKENNFPIPQATLIHKNNSLDYSLVFDFPAVVKPLRGRGSQGVFVVRNRKELEEKLAL